MQNNNLLDLGIKTEKLERWASYSTNKKYRILVSVFSTFLLLTIVLCLIFIFIFKYETKVLISLSIVASISLITWFLFLAPFTYLMITSFWTYRAIKQPNKPIYKNYKEANWWIKIQLNYANFGFKMFNKKALHLTKEEYKLFVNFYMNVKQ